MMFSILSIPVSLKLIALRSGEAAFAAAVALAPPAGLAQSINYTSMEATAGQALQLTFHGTAHVSDCGPAPLPEVRALEPPQHGFLTVRRGQLTTDRIQKCPNLTVPAEVVFYTGRDGYSGPDHLRYEVTDINGESNIYDVAITVKAPGAALLAPSGGASSGAVPVITPASAVPAGQDGLPAGAGGR